LAGMEMLPDETGGIEVHSLRTETVRTPG